MSLASYRTYLRDEMPHDGRFERIEAWAERQLGESAGRLDPVEIRQRLPRPFPLRYNAKATQSPNGGRFDFHLRHLEDTEVIERVARADRFLERTVTLPRSDDSRPDPGPAAEAPAAESRSDDPRSAASG